MSSAFLFQEANFPNKSRATQRSSSSCAQRAPSKHAILSAALQEGGSLARTIIAWLTKRKPTERSDNRELCSAGIYQHPVRGRKYYKIEAIGRETLGLCGCLHDLSVPRMHWSEGPSAQYLRPLVPQTLNHQGHGL